MVDRCAKQRATLQSTRELPGELLHASDRGHLRHVFTQHVEIFQQHGALIFQCWLKRFALTHRIFDLTKDPGVDHRAAAN